MKTATLVFFTRRIASGNEGRISDDFKTAIWIFEVATRATGFLSIHDQNDPCICQPTNRIRYADDDLIVRAICEFTFASRKGFHPASSAQDGFC